MSTQSLDSDIYDYGFILNSTALHEAAMSVLVTTIYGRWRGTTTIMMKWRRKRPKPDSRAPSVTSQAAK